MRCPSPQPDSQVTQRTALLGHHAQFLEVPLVAGDERLELLSISLCRADMLLLQERGVGDRERSSLRILSSP